MMKQHCSRIDGGIKTDKDILVDAGRRDDEPVLGVC